jgi:hypothetical protein
MRFSDLNVSGYWRGGTCPYAAVASHETDDPEKADDDWLIEMHKRGRWGMHFRLAADPIAFIRRYVDRSQPDWERLYRDLYPWLREHSLEPTRTPGMLRNLFYFFGRMRSGEGIAGAHGSKYHMVGQLRSNDVILEDGSPWPFQREVAWTPVDREGWPAPIPPGRKVPEGHMTTLKPLVHHKYAEHIDKLLKQHRIR